MVTLRLPVVRITIRSLVRSPRSLTLNGRVILRPVRRFTRLPFA